jgi:hypothetical protein
MLGSEIPNAVTRNAGGCRGAFPGDSPQRVGKTLMVPSETRSTSALTIEIAAQRSARVAESLRDGFNLPAGATSSLAGIRDDDRLPALLLAIDLHRVASPLAQHPELFEFAPETARGIRGMHLAASRDALGLMAQTSAACSLLTQVGLRSLVMKGVGMAAVQGRSPSARGSGDLDLWVHIDDVIPAIEYLATIGYQPEDPAAAALVGSASRRGRIYRWITPEITLLHKELKPIDLHFRLLRSTTHVPIDFDEAWESSVLIAGTDGDGRTLCAEHALRHAAAHATKDCWDTLRHVVDIVYLARMIGDAQLRNLCIADPSVDLALAVASNLDPGLARYATASRGTHRRARVAWKMCLSLSKRPQSIAVQNGWANIRSRSQVLVWQVRTAPDLGTALHPMVEAPVSMRALTDPVPLPLGIMRDILKRTSETRQ